MYALPANVTPEDPAQQLTPLLPTSPSSVSLPSWRRRSFRARAASEQQTLLHSVLAPVILFLPPSRNLRVSNFSRNLLHSKVGQPVTTSFVSSMPSSPTSLTRPHPRTFALAVGKLSHFDMAASWEPHSRTLHFACLDIPPGCRTPPRGIVLPLQRLQNRPTHRLRLRPLCIDFSAATLTQDRICSRGKTTSQGTMSSSVTDLRVVARDHSTFQWWSVRFLFWTRRITTLHGRGFDHRCPTFNASNKYIDV